MLPGPVPVLLQRLILFSLLCSCSLYVHAEDTVFLKVHFLYGSRPLYKYRKAEPKWFGGILGGHTGIEGDSGKIINFVPQGKFHVFSQKQNRHSRYAIHSERGFYSILGGNCDSVKKTIVYVPVTVRQRQLFDSLTACYQSQTPYDYAFFGMRCGAAAYDILGHLSVLPAYNHRTTSWKIFYPKKLRKRLLKLARQHHWRVDSRPGCGRRKWESD